MSIEIRETAYSLARFFGYARNGDSFFRAHQNEFAREVEIGGKILDLGSKSSKSKHLKYLNLREGARFTFTDLHPEDPMVVEVDFREPLPFPSNSFDTVLLMNVLEHLQEPTKLLNESFRVLKPGGKLIGIVPFMFPYHADPEDFQRFTHEGIIDHLMSLGLTEPRVVKLGVGARTVSSGITAGFQKFWFSRFLSWTEASVNDFVSKHLGSAYRRDKNKNFYLGVGFRGKKP